MTRDNASRVARGIAAKMGLPAFIYIDAEYKAENPACHSLYQVACMRWQHLTDCQRAAAVAVVLPNGREFTAMPQYARHWAQPKPVNL